jgi:hypothetical protein
MRDATVPSGRPVTIPRFDPTFVIGQSRVVLHPPETISGATNELGKFVRSLAYEGRQIIDALDDLPTPAHG